MDTDADWKLGKSYGQWTEEDSYKTDCKFNKTKMSVSLDSRFVDFENTGRVPPWDQITGLVSSY